MHYLDEDEEKYMKELNENGEGSDYGYQLYHSDPLAFEIGMNEWLELQEEEEEWRNI